MTEVHWMCNGDDQDTRLRFYTWLNGVTHVQAWTIMADHNHRPVWFRDRSADRTVGVRRVR